MSVWNKILVGLLIVASLVFFHAAARTVKTYQHWANKTNDFEKKLKEVRAEVVSLRTADHAHPREDKTIGVQQLRIDLGRVLANRGRIWTKCEKQKAAIAASGIMNVTVSSDEPTSFAKNMLLYAFEEGDDQSPGKYLGEFHVDSVSDRAVVLASTTEMVKSGDPKAPSLADNVLASKSPWVLYELMPTDEHEAFANLSEDQRKWVADEFLKDQQRVDANGNITQDSSGKKFERPLRDYLAIFRACEMHRTLFNDRLESVTRDLSYLTAAGKEAERVEAVAEKEKTQVTGELKRAQIERAAVASLLASRQNMLGIFQKLVQEAIARNVKFAAEIARMQKQLFDEIDRRTRAMAQFGPRTS